jgi:ABC-type uncharacterized transport system ATPase subunit
MAGQAALAADRLTKRFGDRVAFQDVSFQVGYGEVFGFLGPNGAGKTTIHATLRLTLLLGILLLIADLLGWRIVRPLLDRERLIVGIRS